MTLKPDWHQIRQLLCRLEDHIRDAVVGARADGAGESFSRIAEVSAADTIYEVDKISEAAIFAWFRKNWPAEWPVKVVMEGIDDAENVVFPEGAEPVLICILDPIDGTRNIMYDKRSAWVIGGIGLIPDGRAPRLRDLQVAAMTELPTTKQGLADQVSGLRGAGPQGLVAERISLVDGSRRAFPLAPSRAKDLRHGFAAISRFFPEGKGLLAQLEEELWRELLGTDASGSPLVFDDQYICSAGQFYELLVGHDRFLADLRPLVFAKLGMTSPLVCHPYDVCTALLLEEAGVVLEDAEGQPLDAPLDTVSPVAWVGYANPVIAKTVRPVLHRLMEKRLK